MTDRGIKYVAKIHSNFNSDIIWQRGTTDYLLTSTDVHVWNVRIDDHFHTLFKEFKSILSREEFYKAKGFYWERDCKKYLTGRIVLRILLSKYLSKASNNIQFNTDGGKPTISSRIPLKYNLSYSNKHILISIGKCETGVDAESIQESFDFENILSSCFSNKEIEYINSNERNQRKEFYLQWTRKEALLKYTGQGLIDDLTVIPTLNGIHRINNKDLLLDTDINLLSFNLDHDEVGSLAYPTSISTVGYFQWK